MKLNTVFNNITKNYYKKYRYYEWTFVIIFLMLFIFCGKSSDSKIYLISTYVLGLNLLFMFSAIRIKRLINKGKIISYTTKKICEFEGTYSIYIVLILFLITLYVTISEVLNWMPFSTLRMWIIFDIIVLACIRVYCFDFCIIFFDQFYFVGYRKFYYQDITTLHELRCISHGLSEGTVCYEIFRCDKKIGCDKFYLCDYNFLYSKIKRESNQCQVKELFSDI